MSFNKSPLQHIGNYQLVAAPTLVSGSIVIPVASLLSLDNPTADGATGDIRAVLLSIVDTLYQNFQALEPQDKPLKLTIRRTTTERADGIHRTYVLNSIVVGELDVAPE